MILIDEADYFMYYKTMEYYHLSKKYRIIAFTATASDNTLDGLEKSISEALHFSRASYWPKDLPKPDVVPPYQSLFHAYDALLIGWLKSEVLERPVLLFCDEHYINVARTNGLHPKHLDGGDSMYWMDHPQLRRKENLQY